jgi:hypothetical protein
LYPWRTWLERIAAGTPPVGEILAAGPSLLASRPDARPGEPYARQPLHRDDLGEVMLATWTRGAACAPHDHAAARGGVVVLAGSFVEIEWSFDRGLIHGATRRWRAGDVIPVDTGTIHSMRDGEGGATLHFYVPAISGMRVYDPARRETLVVADDCGAWIPTDPAVIVNRQHWT